mgnify:CR=1 FL=1
MIETLHLHHKKCHFEYSENSNKSSSFKMTFNILKVLRLIYYKLVISNLNQR